MALTTEQEQKVIELVDNNFDRIVAFLSIDQLKIQLKQKEAEHNAIIEKKQKELKDVQALAQTELDEIRAQIIALETPE